MSIFQKIRMGSILMGLMNKLKKQGGGDMKSGWRTTEFWVAIGASLVSILSVIGVIPSGAETELTAAIEKIAAGSIAAVSAVGYIWGRSKVKSEGENAKKGKDEEVIS